MEKVPGNKILYRSILLLINKGLGNVQTSNNSSINFLMNYFFPCLFIQVGTFIPVSRVCKLGDSGDFLTSSIVKATVSYRLQDLKFKNSEGSNQN